MKTIYGNRGRRKNDARKLTIAEGLASTKKRVAKGSRREGIGAKRRATANRMCPVCCANCYENQGEEWVQCCDPSSSLFHEECAKSESDFFSIVMTIAYDTRANSQ
ncbi:hypothetical protein TNCV_1282801 [Trichonephila clavipes]|uniref:Uncharacterized protein n=1 Tax=Trichonephila clavipes TaxID=2585209 RepID=A0A8X6SKW4_TRICX|nr:hypothetical protein TNCV_1282801 [Trichonephila clavipes]